MAKIWLSKKQICLKYHSPRGYKVKTFSLNKSGYIKKILDFICDETYESFFMGLPKIVYEYAVRKNHRITRSWCLELCSFS